MQIGELIANGDSGVAVACWHVQSGARQEVGARSGKIKLESANDISRGCANSANGRTVRVYAVWLCWWLGFVVRAEAVCV
ncbi:Translation initiation factor IF-1 [Candidatus Hodgkinia cicadicola]|nr:Translation initiation factor IF-1 [Candidatus Hodgkinia cicadicola]